MNDNNKVVCKFNPMLECEHSIHDTRSPYHCQNCLLSKIAIELRLLRITGIQP